MQDKEEKEWTPVEIERLIDYYRDNEELWNHNLAEYRDRQLKELNLKSLSTLLPGRSVDAIKKEWTTLKTIFSRDVKSEEGSKVSGTGTESVYSSSWRYLKSMLFIKGSDDIDPQASTLDADVENVEAHPPKRPRSNKVTSAKEMEEAKLQLYKQAVKCLQMPIAQVPITPTSASNDEITSFLKSVEMSLRQFSRRDLTRAKKEINDVIFDLEMNFYLEKMHNLKPLHHQCLSATSQITTGCCYCCCSCRSGCAFCSYCHCHAIKTWLLTEGSGMAVRRVLLSSGTLCEILVIWLVERLNLLGLTAKERDVSTDSCTKYKTGNLKFFSRLYRTRFFAFKPSKGYFVSRLPRYPNSTSTFHSKRLVESGDINPNPGPENTLFSEYFAGIAVWESNLDTRLLRGQHFSVKMADSLVEEHLRHCQSPDNLNKFTIVELKEYLSQRDLNLSGTKNELCEKVFYAHKLAVLKSLGAQDEERIKNKLVNKS